MDVQTKQQMNIEQQRLTASEAEHVHLDMLGRQIEARIQVANLHVCVCVCVCICVCVRECVHVCLCV